MECECGYTYEPGYPDDEVCHSKIHSEYLYGPEIPAIRMLTPSVAESSLPIYIIDETCPKEIRRDIAHVARVAWYSMQHFPVGYGRIYCRLYSHSPDYGNFDYNLRVLNVTCI